MMSYLTASDSGFASALDELLSRRAGEGTSVGETVAAILSEVRRRGDAALMDYTQRFDALSLTQDQLRFSNEERIAIEAECPADVRQALELAAERIYSFHARQTPQDSDYTDALGVRLGMRWRPVDAVGMYVPGGRAAYPSSVLMNAIPAQVAGVTRLVMVVPTPAGEVNPAVLVAARLAGVHEIYRVGGAQAIAALAYGTESIAPVQLIVGPGNAYVAEAKRRVFGKVGIDMIAGPSEILVVADASTPAHWIAADLLSQAEHDPDAQSILITDDAAYAQAVETAIDQALQTLLKRAIAEASWRDYGGIILVDDLTADTTLAIINRIAAEHLELAIESPELLLPRIRHAGAIFLGRYTPEAIGDYLAGPSHVLPTMQTAAFASGLSVYSFMKKSSLIGCSPEAFAALAAPTALLADTEGLGAHALSVRVRVS
ncbi:MAG: histidinol dehydrogenase [Rickettsiales bacterium]|nr:histidinol dehydrogenase [Rickettsiales bacterium]